jgi:ubiquinone/menaquinone biosynthesis C-methylase UbiE
MPDLSARTDVERTPVIYAGRFVDEIPDADVAGNCIVLDKQDALPHKLAGVLERANALVLLDLLSFPLEAMTDDHWDLPIVVVIPSGFDVESWITNFDSVLFERLGFFDRIVVPESATWEELRRKYRWAESQRIPVVSDHPSEVAKTVRTFLATESVSRAAPGADGIDHVLRFNKALYRVQAAALEPRFAAAREKRDTKVPLDVLEVGTGVGLWAMSFDPAKTRFVGIDAREDLVAIARATFPNQHFDHLGSGLLFPYEDESFDLAFSVTVMHQHPAPAKRTLLSEMWRVTRPGARLLFLETFVFPEQPEEPAIYPLSVTEFVDLIRDATAGQVVLEYVESLRYPGEDLRRGGLISLLRLGVSRT